MATTTTHYGFTKPGVNDYVDISVLNANFDNLDTVIYSNRLSAQAALDDIAPEYDATATYSVGDYVTYNKTLYKCATAITTAEAFDDTKWTAVKVGGELKNHDERISDLEAGVELEGAATNSFDDGIDSYFKKVVSSIVPVQAGSGTPSPTNERAISGFTECEVNNCGKNLYNKATSTDGYRIGSDGQPYPDGNYSISDWIMVDSSAQYNRNITLVITEPIALYDSNKDFISRIISGNIFTTTPETKYIRTAVLKTEKDACQIEKGSTPTAYEQYKANTATISFGTAGTVYSGYVDLISGKLVVDKGYKEYNGSEAWVNVGGNYPQAFQLTDTTLQAQQLDMALLAAKNITNLYPWIAADSVNYGIRFQVSPAPTGKIFVYDDNYSGDLSGFLSHIQNTHLQICYLLATPQEYQLTPAQLRSLVGANRLTSNTGEVIEVEYIKNKTIAWLLDLIRA